MKDRDPHCLDGMSVSAIQKEQIEGRHSDQSRRHATEHELIVTAKIEDFRGKTPHFSNNAMLRESDYAQQQLAHVVRATGSCAGDFRRMAPRDNRPVGRARACGIQAPHAMSLGRLSDEKFCIRTQPIGYEVGLSVTSGRG